MHAAKVTRCICGSSSENREFNGCGFNCLGHCAFFPHRPALLHMKSLHFCHEANISGRPQIVETVISTVQVTATSTVTVDVTGALQPEFCHPLWKSY